MAKIVVFYSASGVTRRVASSLADAVGAALHEIEPVDLYTDHDLDWMDKKSRSSLEMKDPKSRPEIKNPKIDLSGFDDVYIGFPIWWGVAPRVVNTFIEANDLSGKRIAIFATSGGSGVDYAVKDLKGHYPELDIKGGKLLRAPVSADIL